jgi:cardiolipin synthase
MLEEGSLVLQDGEAARRMEAFFLEDLKHAREVKPGQAAR